MYQLITLLETHDNPFDYLKDELNIIVKDYGNFVLLDYDQIRTPRFNNIADYCRGTIVDKKSKKIVRKMFTRFYNLGEGNTEDKLDLDSTYLETKEDGSIIGVWFNDYKQVWELGTRGTAFADANVHDPLCLYSSSLTFKDLFLQHYKAITDEDFLDNCFKYFSQNFTYIFELCSLENKVVVTYKIPKIFLTGCIHNETGEESSIKTLDSLSELLKVNRPTRLNFSSFEETIKITNSLKDLEEGYIIIDKNFNRCKLKSLKYVAAHHLKGNQLTTKKALNLVLENEVEEFVSYFEEYKDYFDSLKLKLDLLKENTINEYNLYNSIEDQKEFAIAIKNSKYKSLLFQLRKGLDLDTIIKNNTLDKLLILLGFKDEYRYLKNF